ncbi:hypothetical protein ONZ45_g11467 [Pleurotus djamor]|nr:hypothetical protein ONZ45_g11467 [Pleurotus djamor]
MAERDLSPDNDDFGHEQIIAPCGRCDFKFHYPEGTPWNVVNDMVNGHWTVCPGSISASVAKSRHAPLDPRYPVNFSSSRQEVREGSSSNDEADGDPNSKRNRKKNMMDETERRKKLEDDPWALEVTPISVRCGACTRLVSLDKRSRYYPGLWLKHREKCMEIKRLEAIEQEQGDKQEPPSPTQSPSKKKSKGHESAVSPSSPQGSRSVDPKGKGVQEVNPEVPRLVSMPSGSAPPDAGGFYDAPSRSHHGSMAREPPVMVNVYPDDTGGFRMTGKRRRSPSSPSESEANAHPPFPAGGDA